MNVRACSAAVFAAFLGTTVTAQQAAVPAADLIAPSAPCASLAGMKIAAAAIGLPTTGATITTAELIPPSEPRVNNNQVALAVPEYCKVNGVIAPVDPAAPNINFQVNLPSAWNGKTIQLGGSGTNGVIPIALTTSMQWGPESIPPDAPYALTRGFVEFGSDSGHQQGAGRATAAAPAAAAPVPARAARGGTGGGTANDWASNDEALTNFAYGQMKKTHDVAFRLVRALYGRGPRRSYYMGSSQGGREALMMAQRFPQDYDGIFCQVPVFLQLQWNMIDDTLRAKSQIGDAWIPRDKVAVIGTEVLRQCDALDGLVDGFVSNYVACNRLFDPAITANPFVAVRCADGNDSGPACLSDPQIAAANAVHKTVDFGFPLAHGWTSAPGWTTGGELANNWKLVATQPTADTPIGGMLGSLVVRDPNVTLGRFNLADYRVRLRELSELLDANNPDLSAFQRRGGKLILKVNTTDYTANPRWSYAYYQKVVETMTQPVVDRFMRFYVAVGIFHNRNVGTNPLTNDRVPSYVDFIAMLDSWVETGTPPADRQVLTSMDAAPPFAITSSLPMCRYPRYPHYKGSGERKDAANYVCTMP